MAVGRFVVRAWVSVVLVGYAVAFTGAAQRSSRRATTTDRARRWASCCGSSPEAVFWTFHAFSPVFIDRQPRWMHTTSRQRSALPFYERVNRFVFGPRPPEPDRACATGRSSPQIRRLEGRVVPGDLMRVHRRFAAGGRAPAAPPGRRSGRRHPGERDRRHPLRVSRAAHHRGGARRPGRRFAAGLERARAPAPADRQRRGLQPAVLGHQRLQSPGEQPRSRGRSHARAGLGLVARHGVVDAPPLPPPDGIPLAVGLVPFAFSVALFALPLWRTLRRSSAASRVASENGRRGLLKILLDDGQRGSNGCVHGRRSWRRPGWRADGAPTRRARARTGGPRVDG